MFRIVPCKASGGGECNSMTEAGKNVLEVSSGTGVIKNLDRRDRGNAETHCTFAHASFRRDILRAAMARDHRVEPVTESVFQIPRDEYRIREPRNQARVSAPQGDEPLRVLAHFPPAHHALALGGAQPSVGDEIGEVRVALSLIHISEPTRLLSISYAVFCLKKKK